MKLKEHLLLLIVTVSFIVCQITFFKSKVVSRFQDILDLTTVNLLKVFYRFNY